MSEVGQKKNRPQGTKKITKKQAPSTRPREVEEVEEHSEDQSVDLYGGQESDEQSLPTPPASPKPLRKKQASLQKTLNSRKKRTPKPQYQEPDEYEDGGPLDDVLNAPGQLVGQAASAGKELVQGTAGQVVNKAQDTVGRVEDTVSGVTGALAGGSNNSDKKEQLRLRLDLNLVSAARSIVCDDSRADVFAIVITGS